MSQIFTPPDDVRRRELVHRWQQARQLMEEPSVDRDNVHWMLVDCVAEEPANLFFLETFFDNLRAKYDGSRAAGGWLRRRAVRRAARRDDWARVLRDGPHALFFAPWDPHVLTAIAAANLHFGEPAAAWRYLQFALQQHGDNRDVRALAARTLEQLGDVETAARLRSDAPLDEPSEAGGNPADCRSTDECLRRAQESLDAGQFDTARAWVQQAQSLGGADPRTWHLDEAIRLRHVNHRLSIAEARAAQDASDEANEVVRELRREQNRVELEVFMQRLQRDPESPEWQTELAIRLRRAGKIYEAIKHFEAAQHKQPTGRRLFELAECHQRLKRFERARQMYQESLKVKSAAEDKPADWQQEAMRRIEQLTEPKK